MTNTMTATPRGAGRRLVLSLGALLALACGLSDIGKPAEGTTFVSIKDNIFQPESVAVQQGGSVRWTNDGLNLHSVVEDSGRWQSQLLSPTMWFEVRFDSLGTFTYHCSLHAEMTGVVMVQ